MLMRMGSSIGASYREFEGYSDTLGALGDILQDKSRRVIAKHRDDIKAAKEDLVEQRVQEIFGVYAKDQHIDEYRFKQQGENFDLKKAAISLFNPLPSLINFAKNLFFPAAMGLVKICLRASISNRSIEKLLVGQDIEKTFQKFSANLTERLEQSQQPAHLKLNLPDLLDIQRALKFKASYDQSTYGALGNSTESTLQKLSDAFDDKKDPGLYKGLDAHTAALVRNISHEILRESKSSLIPANWGPNRAEDSPPQEIEKGFHRD